MFKGYCFFPDGTHTPAVELADEARITLKEYNKLSYDDAKNIK